MTTTPKEYLKKAKDALVQLKAATSDSERLRLKRMHGSYIKLSTHAAEAAARAELAPAPRIVPEKQPITSPFAPRGWTLK